MKGPLHYQITNYDCGPISFINGLCFLLDREEIPISIIKMIWNFCLDCYGEDLVLGTGGTSRESMTFLCKQVASYSKQFSFCLCCFELDSHEMTHDSFKKIILEEGVIVYRCFQTEEHYALITDIQDDTYYLFDPYYISESFVSRDKGVTFDFHHPSFYNRIVSKKRIFSKEKEDFSMVGEKRQCIVLKRER